MKKCIPVLTVITAGIFWATVPLFSRALSDLGLTSMQIGSLRPLVGAIGLWIFLLLFKPRVLRVRLRDLPVFILMGLVGMLLVSVCYFTAIEMTTASVAAILLYTSPIFILIFSCLFLGEVFTRRKLTALIFASLGCLLVSGVFDTSAVLTPQGFFVGLLSGIFYALYSIFGRVALRRYEAMTVSAYAFGFAGIGALFFVDFPAAVPAVLSGGNVLVPILTVIGLGLVTSLVPFCLYTYGLARMDAGRAGILACIEPMVATVISVTVLQEDATPAQWGGIVLILCAVILLNLSVSKKKENM